jgi:hypothetical protein
VPVAGGEERDVVLRRLRVGDARLDARIVDAATGAPLDPLDAKLLRVPSAHADPNSSRTMVQRTPGVVQAERLHPGPWRLWVRAEGRAAGYADFDVADGHSAATITVALGRAGSVRGRVDWSACAARRASADTLPWPEAMATPGGAGWEAHGRLRGFTRVDPDGTFTIDGLAPGRTIVRLHAQGVLGEAVVDVPPAGVADATIVARPAGVLRLRTASPVPAGTARIVVETAKDGEAWRTQMIVGGAAGRRFEHDSVLPAGPTRWRIRFLAGNGDLLESAPAREGRADLVTGETTVIDLP